MRTRLRLCLLVALFIFPLIGCSSAHNYTLQWSINFSDSIHGMKMSRDGDYIVLLNGTENTTLVHHTGDIEWVQPYSCVERMGATSSWIDIDEYGDRIITTHDTGIIDYVQMEHYVFDNNGNEIFHLTYPDHESHCYCTIFEDGATSETMYATAKEDIGMAYYNSTGDQKHYSDKLNGINQGFYYIDGGFDPKFPTF